MKPLTTIGFDRDIELSWLDATAGQVARGTSTKEIHAYLRRLLDGVVSGDKPRSGRGKTITVLMHIWADVPESARGLRDHAVSLLPEVSQSERVALHWAMAVATYPFFADVATAIGRLLSLQANASLTQLNLRLSERWGDRSTMTRAARRCVRSMVRWGTLRDSREPGVYVPIAPVAVEGMVGEVLLEALLADGQPAVPLSQALVHPTLFPFQNPLSATQLRTSRRFETRREGPLQELLALRR